MTPITAARWEDADDVGAPADLLLRLSLIRPYRGAMHRIPCATGDTRMSAHREQVRFDDASTICRSESRIGRRPGGKPSPARGPAAARIPLLAADIGNTIGGDVDRECREVRE